MPGGPGSGKGLARLCLSCERKHHRKTDLCHECTGTDAEFALTGGHWLADARGIQRYLS